MHKAIHKEGVLAALAKRGWNQRVLAKEIGVTPQSVTNWLKGEDFPRPDKLLKLATVLKLSFDQLVEQPKDLPIVAFRKKAGTKTTDKYVLNARNMGQLLGPLVQFLPAVPTLRAAISSPTRDYAKLQSNVAEARAKLGVGERAMLEYEQLIGEFKACGAVLVPVLWGRKQRHENALHLLLPRENTTFVFLNLDTRLEDFKFWMAHELAHVYTPELAGTNEGEDFADAFAGALLFPEDCAQLAYGEAIRAAAKGEIPILQKHSDRYEISLLTVYLQIKHYAHAKGLAPLRTAETMIQIDR